jgi:hypothetical protein
MNGAELPGGTILRVEPATTTNPPPTTTSTTTSIDSPDATYHPSLIQELTIESDADISLIKEKDAASPTSTTKSGEAVDSSEMTKATVCQKDDNNCKDDIDDDLDEFFDSL